MASRSDDNILERTSSQTSTASRKSGVVRTKSRKQSLIASTSSLATPTPAKTLESFPSLSPDGSPASKQRLLASPRPGATDDTPRKPSKSGPSTVESLITSSPSFRGRSALFQDSPKASPTSNDIHGALHHASNDHIQGLIKNKGAVALVRQLSQEMAERDAEMTIFRRRAEERERELKRMLREVEVSNMDIEKRLHRLEGPEQLVGLGLQDPAGKKHVGATERAGKAGNAGVTNGIDEMMGEAMKDDVGISELDEGYLDSLTKNDKQATVKARSILSKESDARSMASSMDSQGRPSSTLRGWKDYIWKGDATSRKTSRASSVSEQNDGDDITVRNKVSTGGNTRRRGLNDDLFSPPTRASTIQSEAGERSSRKSSSGVSSWTVKLFGGNAQAGRDPEGKSTMRGRSATTGDGVTKPSRTISGPVPPVPPIPQSAKAALLKVNGMDPTRPPKTPQPLRVGGNAPTKPTSQQHSAQMPSSPAAVDSSSTNLGPVEMDTIHPDEMKPPTLTQSNDKISKSDDLLTDRFGFIYDQRRRKKEAEAVSHKRARSTASAHVEMIGGVREPLMPKENDQLSPSGKANSLERPDTPMSQDDRTDDKPTKRWQDFLKVATFPTELLSHTPSAQPATIVISPESPPVSHLKRSSTSGISKSGNAGASLPSISLIPEPEMSPITAGNAEITKSSLSPSSAETDTASAETEPVKLLLSQLTELHDNLQREKTVKWNEFLRKVRAERKKEGETLAIADPRSKASATPEVTLTDGEMIGVAGLGNKGKVGRAKWNEFKQLVLSGIPVSYRAKIWAECSGASALRVPGYYEDLVADRKHDDPTIASQIQMDIHRTLTDNVFFRKGPGVAKLNEVLLAYSRRNPEVGYCQGMNLITASLLLIMPTAEDAFWLLTSLIENILPRHYYDHSLLASRADQQVLRQYVAEILPKLSVHLDELGIELEALTFQWFLSIFTDCLSAEALFRVWDVVLCFNDGSTFLFQVALALLKLNEGQLLNCDNPARIYSYIGNEMTDHAISIDGLIGASEALKKVVTRAEVEERRFGAVEEQRERERGGNGELKQEEPRPYEG